MNNPITMLRYSLGGRDGRLVTPISQRALWEAASAARHHSMLSRIETRLWHPRYADKVRDFTPAGFDAEKLIALCEHWSATYDEQCKAFLNSLRSQ